MRTKLSVVGLTCIALAASPACSTVASGLTLSLTRGSVNPTYYPAGYAGGSDNTIFYYAMLPKWMRSSDGAGQLSKAQNGPTTLRTLTRFDLAGLAGQNIVVTGNATLKMTVYPDAPGGDYSLYQIAGANAGWTESTNAVTSLFPSSAPTTANPGDPTWYYKSTDTSYDPATTYPFNDTTSTPWASGHLSVGNAGSNPEGYNQTGGLWNWIDLVDQNPATVANSYLTMGNMDPVSSIPYTERATRR